MDKEELNDKTAKNFLSGLFLSNVNNLKLWT